MVGLGIVEPTEAENAEFLSLGERVDRAVALLRENEPEEGYWLAFSGERIRSLSSILPNVQVCVSTPFTTTRRLIRLNWSGS